MIHTQLLLHMMDYYKNDPKRIQHFLKVHSFAKLIGTLENLDTETQTLLEVTAIVHDIGIKKAEALYGNCSGKLQEELGPDIAKKLLITLDYSDEFITNVLFLIAHHHT